MIENLTCLVHSLLCNVCMFVFSFYSNQDDNSYHPDDKVLDQISSCSAPVCSFLTLREGSTHGTKEEEFPPVARRPRWSSSTFQPEHGKIRRQNKSRAARSQIC